MRTASRRFSTRLTEELVRQQRDNSGERLFGLYNIFKTQVFHALAPKEFADAFAQMLVYGLFLAKLNAKPTEKITLENARANVPGSFRLIRELVSLLDELEKDEYVEIRWGLRPAPTQPRRAQVRCAPFPCVVELTMNKLEGLVTWQPDFDWYLRATSSSALIWRRSIMATLWTVIRNGPNQPA